MPSCKEFFLDDMLAITTIPIDHISAGDINSPVNRLTPTIDKAIITDNMLAGSVTIGLKAVGTDGVLIPIMRRTGKVKDDESDSVAGRLHTVNVTCDVDGRDSDVWDRLLALERTPSHLMLTFRGGAQAFVSASRDTYLCNVARDGAKTTVSFRVQDLMGVQMMD